MTDALTLPLDRTLLQYLPPVLREVLEFQAINRANEPEIAAAWAALEALMANQFLETADERGVAVWERELRLHPKDTDSLEARKTRIKAMWNMELPYTLPWLRKWLNGLVGEGNHSETVEDYTLLLELCYSHIPQAGDQAREIMELLRTVRPCNLHITLTALLRSQGAVRVGVGLARSHLLCIYPKPEGQRVLARGTVAVGGAWARAVTRVIYPKEA